VFNIKSKKRVLSTSISASMLLPFKKVHSEIKAAFQKVKAELSEHLDSINQNTSEIQETREYLGEIDAKLEKLNERLEEISLFIGMNKDREELINPVKSLTINEKEVFMTIYALGEEKENLTYEDIAKSLGLTEQKAKCYVDLIESKGIPLMKRFVSGKVQLRLNPDFKRMQTKENLLNINEAITQKILDNF